MIFEYHLINHATKYATIKIRLVSGRGGSADLVLRKRRNAVTGAYWRFYWVEETVRGNFAALFVQ